MNEHDQRGPAGAGKMQRQIMHTDAGERIQVVQAESVHDPAKPGRLSWPFASGGIGEFPDFQSEGVITRNVEEPAGSEYECRFALPRRAEAEAFEIDLQGDDLCADGAEGLDELFQIQRWFFRIRGWLFIVEAETQIRMRALKRQAIDFAFHQAGPPIVRCDPICC